MTFYELKMSLSVIKNDWILCNYQNRCKQTQVIRISNINYWFLEKVIFPQKNILFYAPKSAKLEVYNSCNPHIMLEDKIPCIDLSISTTIDIKLA
jgi:hypothetical protein